MTPADGPPSPPSTTTILIVDDDLGLLRLLEKSLRREGFDTASATTGKKAVGWLEQRRADLLLLDLNLPDIAGQELIHRLGEAGKAVPFIVITGHSDVHVAVDMMRRGAVDYLVKDRQFLELVPTVVQSAMAQLEQKKRLAAAEAALRVSEERFRVALKNSPITVFNQDQDLRYTWVHHSRIEQLGRSVLGKKNEDLFRPEEAARLTELQRRVQTTGVGEREEVHCTIGDATLVYDLTIEPVREPGGRTVGVTCAATDITERKRLEKEISQISELEQRRIGQDLHDGLCQHLAGIEFMSQVLQQKLAAKAQPEAASATDIAKLVREAISHTRDLARGLSPVVLESEGLMSALQELAESTEKRFGVRCRLRCDVPVLIHDNAVATQLYRIAQEAVNNAIKHGKARRIEVSLSASAGQIALGVKDNGAGMPKPLPRSGGMGLRIMNYRAGMVGASLTIHKPPEGGTRVVCALNNSGDPAPAPMSYDSQKERTSH